MMKSSAMDQSETKSGDVCHTFLLGAMRFGWILAHNPAMSRVGIGQLLS
jgi:hypothetical protein